jgi:competence protein ComEA
MLPPVFVPDPVPPVWSPAARLALAGLMLVAGALLVGYVFGLTRTGTRPLTLVGYQLDVNTADADELEQLPGIGPAKAQRIMQQRTQHGPLQSTADLAPAVGPNTAQRVQPLTTLSTAAVPTPSRKGELLEPLNVNTASLEELQRLPGIGPKLGQRILDERTRGPFRSVDDLRRVSGIGVKTLEKLRPHVRVTDD